MTRFWRLTLAFFLFLGIGFAQVLHARSASPRERQKIEALIKYVGEMNDAKFVRNGSTYDAQAAATFLRLKWEANDSEVKTARNLIATFSGTSGKPYVIRFKDGNEIDESRCLAGGVEQD